MPDVAAHQSPIHLHVVHEGTVRAAQSRLVMDVRRIAAATIVLPGPKE